MCDDLLQEHMLDLINQINNKQISIKEKTDTILYKCLCKSNDEDIPILYISILYKLIFHCYKQAPEVTYQILSGFIHFGQSVNGRQFKPMMDYFAIEAINGLLKMGGWSILKPCLITLYKNIQNLNKEPIFKHILERICRQLKTDVNDVYSSDLCYNLPREKSFTWGWFSYIIAEAYYGESNSIVSAKNTRQYMMYYRKLLTTLRKNMVEVTLNEDQDVDVPFQIEETWNGILKTFNTAEYQWVNMIVAVCITGKNNKRAATSEAATSEAATSEAEPSEAEPSEAEPSEAEPSEAEPSEAEPSEAEPSEAAKSGAEPSEAEPSEAEPIEVITPSEAEPSEAEPIEVITPSEAEAETEPIKNTSWLYSLFGWS
jgi:hypothetical protein